MYAAGGRRAARSREAAGCRFRPARDAKRVSDLHLDPAMQRLRLGLNLKEKLGLRDSGSAFRVWGGLRVRGTDVRRGGGVRRGPLGALLFMYAAPMRRRRRTVQGPQRTVARCLGIGRPPRRGCTRQRKRKHAARRQQQFTVCASARGARVRAAAHEARAQPAPVTREGASLPGGSFEPFTPRAATVASVIPGDQRTQQPPKTCIYSVGRLI